MTPDNISLSQMYTTEDGVKITSLHYTKKNNISYAYTVQIRRAKCSHFSKELFITRNNNMDFACKVALKPNTKMG